MDKSLSRAVYVRITLKLDSVSMEISRDDGDRAF
jgi:hypothetical protein